MPTKPQLRITPGTWILWALMLLILPLNWLLAAATAAFFHECCHFLALRLCDVPVFRIEISSRGARMDTAPMGLRQEFFCALAGPLGGLFLLLFLMQIPRIAICAAAQSLFNLLPLYPLDGGRAVRCLALHFLPAENAQNLLKWVAWLCLGGIFILSLLATLYYHLGILPLLLAFGLCIRSKNEKSLANLRS
jgi:stage IV sporulation protein FB